MAAALPALLLITTLCKIIRVPMGGFQLLDLILPELKSYVIPYKFKLVESKSCKGFFFTNEFSTNENT